VTIPHSLATWVRALWQGFTWDIKERRGTLGFPGHRRWGYRQYTYPERMLASYKALMISSMDLPPKHYRVSVLRQMRLRIQILWKVMKRDVHFRIQALTGCGRPARLIERWRWAVWDTELLSRASGKSYLVWRVMKY